MTYSEFIARKSQIGGMSGFEPVWMPDFLIDFQASITDWAIRKGRAAILADCGMGKTPMQLVFSENVVRKTNGRILILTPLAVGSQTVKEAEKFGIEAGRSRDGTIPKEKIVITNYEQLEKFDPSYFVGVVCDECFPAGTLIDTPLGKKRIETIRENDTILNAHGVDVVSDVHRREVQYAVRILFDGVPSITVSPNHPVFTQRGWVCAQDVEPGDSVLQTNAAMRMVQKTVHSSGVSGQWASEILREILLSEMAHEHSGTSGEGSYSRSGGKKGEGEGGMVQVRKSEGESRDRADKELESDVRPVNTGEGEPHIETNEAQTFRTWRKRKAADSPSTDYDECSRLWVGARIEHFAGTKDSRLSDVLQSRLREQRNKSRYRGGWIISSSVREEGSGQEEGREVGFVRVEGLEVLERGHTELERLRDADGKLYFYDLGATRHPSYSVNGLLVHNSSILKSFSGARQKQITRFMSKLPYRLLCTATAAPNDYVELGTSSEALGELSYSDMLRMFFQQLDDKGQKNEKKKQEQAEAIIADDPNYFRKLAYRVAQTIGQWRLKHHAISAFWRWVVSWAKACRMPSDLGFSNKGFVLPKLTESDHIITIDEPPPGRLFNVPAFGLSEEREERTRTLKQRCEFVAKLVNHKRSAVVWCHSNAEGDLLEKIIPDAKQIAGKTPDDRKLELYDAFANRELRVLVIKPKIGAWGLNWQHCNHVVTFASHSYEQYYQSVRRCWRFGQKKPVQLDVVATEGELRVIANMRRKAQKADIMFTAMIAEMNNATGIKTTDIYTKELELPSWMS